MRLIDADELKKEITSAFHGALGATVTIAMHELIDKQPTIDPESLRPIAHWEAYWEDVYEFGLCTWSGKCSACKEWSAIPHVRLAHYCPNCGAKMEIKNDDEK